MPQTRRELLFFILGGFFLTNAILAELIGGKLFTAPAISLGALAIRDIPLSVGVLIWPVVFITTDLINEYYGKAGVRRLSLLAAAMISYCFAVLYLAGAVPVRAGSPVSAEQFEAVFRQSRWIIVGSVCAFLTAQLVDVAIFVAFRRRTGGRMLWLRATGSTAVSQLVDSYMVAYIGFVIPGAMTLQECLRMSAANYAYKLIIAVLATPLIYAAHALIDRFLARDGAEPEGTGA